jgi:hypothetical protein
MRFFSNRMTRAAVAGLAGLAALWLAGPAQAEDITIGTFGDWTAQYFFEGKGKKTCVIWAKPFKSNGKYRERGGIYLYVTHRPWVKKVNVVSFLAGYPYKKNSEALVLIGGTKFELFTSKDTAWATDARTDRALVQAMRRGRTMTIDGFSSRATRTTDIISLIGFSKALDAIDQACGVK